MVHIKPHCNPSSRLGSQVPSSRHGLSKITAVMARCKLMHCKDCGCPKPCARVSELCALALLAALRMLVHLVSQGYRFHA